MEREEEEEEEEEGEAEEHIVTGVVASKTRRWSKIVVIG